MKNNIIEILYEAVLFILISPILIMVLLYALVLFSLGRKETRKRLEELYYKRKKLSTDFDIL